MRATPPPSRPRLVRPDEPVDPPAGEARPSGRPGWLLPLALAATLIAAAGWGIEARRAAHLQARVVELGGALDAARAEITARQRHLEALRSAAAELEARVGALRTLAERSPTAPSAAPAPAETPAGAP